MPRRQQGRDPKTLGRALLVAQQRPRQQKHADRAALHYADLTTLPSTSSQPSALASVTDRNELDEFLNTAIAAEQVFEAEKQQIVVLESKAFEPRMSNRTARRAATSTSTKQSFPIIPIPRRPSWTPNMSGEELQLAERDAFLAWRRQLATLEESSHTELTPFEKNIEVWKQLWRVIERCTIVAQIVDARNPLLYYSNDLEQYAKELSSTKICVLIINKADYLTADQRRMWRDYLQRKNIKFIFWSAAAAQKLYESKEKSRKDKEKGTTTKMTDNDRELIRVNKQLQRMKIKQHLQQQTAFAVLDNDDEDEEEVEHDDLNEQVAEVKEASEFISDDEDDNGEYDAAVSSDTNSESPESTTLPSDDTVIFNRDQLLNYFRSIHQRHFSTADVPSPAQRLNIGMIGYPNVGKSSTINALMLSKRVTVGATPGKTKHFQTLNIDDDLTLCDCPGLVFPSFTASRAELVCNGIMPIDQMREYSNYTAPIALLVKRVKSIQFQLHYSLIFPSWATSTIADYDNSDVVGVESDVDYQKRANELLSAHARMRGFLKDHGRPDIARSARLLLKDLFNGKLLYCYPPPSLTPEQATVWQQCEEKQILGARYIGHTEFGDEDESDTISTSIRDSMRIKENALVQSVVSAEFDDEIAHTQSASDMPASQATMGMSKKQLLRARQRERHHTGKAFKTRKHSVQQDAVELRVGGNSAQAAMRLGVLQPTKSHQPSKLVQ